MVQIACELTVSINGSGILDVIWLSQAMVKPPPGYKAVTVSMWQCEASTGDGVCFGPSGSDYISGHWQSPGLLCSLLPGHCGCRDQRLSSRTCSFVLERV